MVEGLTDEGGTNLYAGMRAGLDELDGTWAASKVLVVSDGNANVGVTEPTGFYELARRAAAEGATVSTIGLGTDFNEVLVVGVADAGGGSYTATVHVDVPEGVHVHQVYGWDAEVSSGGADVYIGDLSAGQERTIVLQVSIPDQTLGTVPVATATLDYTSLDGATHADTEHLDAIVSDRIGTVERSVDTEAATIAARARASVHLRRSAEAARDGDVSTARARMADARDVVLAAAAQLQVPELAQSVVDLEALEELGAREGNAYAAKAASEASRDWSR
jgi:Ca-activated chloride channel family protein